MAGQDEMTDIMVETYPSNIKRTFAGISINGCMKMIEQYGSDGKNMADTWTVFGDPSVMVRTANPDTMLVAHDTFFVVGDTSLSVLCNLPGARVTLTLNDSILDTELIADSVCTLTFPALQNGGDTIHLLVFAYNYIPYQAYIPVDAYAPVLADFTSLETTIFEFDTVHFIDGSTGDVTSWIWSFPGGTPSSSTEQNPIIIYENDGIYDVQLITGNGLDYDTLLKSNHIHVDFSSSTGEETRSLSCAVSPNPGQGNFLLNMNSPVQELIDLRIFNMVGNTVYRENNISVNGSIRKEINLTHLPQGVYFLKVEGSTSTLTQKIVIQK
jgi:PKD repeat protein